MYSAPHFRISKPTEIQMIFNGLMVPPEFNHTFRFHALVMAFAMSVRVFTAGPREWRSSEEHLSFHGLLMGVTNDDKTLKNCQNRVVPGKKQTAKTQCACCCSWISAMGLRRSQTPRKTLFVNFHGNPEALPWVTGSDPWISRFTRYGIRSGGH